MFSSLNFDYNKGKVYGKLRALYTAYNDKPFILNEKGTSNMAAQLKYMLF